LQEEQAILRLYLNGKVEQFWLREDGNGIVFLMAASTREEAAGQRFFNKIKQCRRVATRYDKLAANYLAFIKLASIRIWLRANESVLERQLRCGPHR
jgi:hypothetical protein